MEHVRYEYSYYLGWSETPTDSSKYVQPGHDNPPAARLPETTNFIPSQLQVGAYQLPPDLLNQMGGAPEWHPPAQKPAQSGTWDATKGEFFPNLPADGKPIADGLAVLLAVYFLGLRRKNFLVMSGTLLALFHLLPGLFAH